MNARAADLEPVHGPVIGPRERVRVTTMFTALLHAVLILGVSFAIEDPAASLPALDVILVQTRTPEKAQNPDFLANATQRGGGEHDKAERPREPVSSPVPKLQPGVAPVPMRASTPEPQPPRPKPVVATTQSPQVVQRSEDALPVPPVEVPSGRELIERSMEMARLAAEIERQSQAYAKRPKRKFLNANTQEYAYAAYMRAWVARVERIGNLNFPPEARTRRITGQLVLTVQVRKDGSVERVDIIQPSGYQLLDEAAIGIVRLAEPFAPLPDTGDQTDILHITRTWQFKPGGTLGTQ